MKNIIFLIILFIGSFNIAYAQIDYCKEITKKVDEMKGVTTLSTPSLSLLDDIHIEKEISNGQSEIFIYFHTTQSIANYDAHGLYIKFDDETILKYPGKAIDCSYLNAEKGYLFGTTRLISDSNPITPYQTKKIVKIQIADKDINVPDEFATKFKAWANCIVDIK